MKHQFYTRQGNRWGLEDLEDHKDFFHLLCELGFEGIIPRNVMIRINDDIFGISQTMIVPSELRILYLLRKKSDTLL